MEQSGLHRFYTSSAEYDQNLAEKGYFNDEMHEQDDLQALTLEQFNRPLIFFLWLWGIVVVIFIGEILVYKWMNWRWY